MELADLGSAGVAVPVVALSVRHADHARRPAPRSQPGEQLLHAMGFRVARVRYHGDVARLEVEPREIPRLLEPEIRDDGRSRVARSSDFASSRVDLKGFRSGSLNEGIAVASTPPDRAA